MSIFWKLKVLFKTSSQLAWRSKEQQHNKMFSVKSVPVLLVIPLLTVKHVTSGKTNFALYSAYKNTCLCIYAVLEHVFYVMMHLRYHWHTPVTAGRNILFQWFTRSTGATMTSLTSAWRGLTLSGIASSVAVIWRRLCQRKKTSSCGISQLPPTTGKWAQRCLNQDESVA